MELIVIIPIISITSFILGIGGALLIKKFLPSDIERNLKQLQEEKIILNERNLNLEKEKSSLETSIKNKEEEITRNISTIDKLKQDNISIQGKYNNLYSQASVMSNHLNILKQDNEINNKLREDIAQLKAKNESYLSQMSIEIEKQNELKDQFDSLRIRFDDLMQDNMRLKTTNDHSDNLLKSEKEISLSTISNIKTDLSKKDEKISELTDKITLLTSKNMELETHNKHLSSKLTTEEELQTKFKNEFENIASKILKDNTTEFSETNKNEIYNLLKPLKERLLDFEKKVEDTFKKDSNERICLDTTIKNLMDQTTKISTEANNLAKALKGQSKTQGCWGEIILQKVLELSGFQEGREFRRQEKFKNEDGSYSQPDIIIDLPENKHIVIDSKVSLISYEKIHFAESEEEEKKYRQEFIKSLKAHVNDLSGKYYQTIKQINSPNFVLLFMPFESSLNIILREDSEIISLAWKNKIIFVTPSTTIAALKTIDMILQQEKQNKNAKEIAEESGKLYDKLEKLVQNLNRVSNDFDKTKKDFESVFKNLHGRGNVVSLAEKIKKMGANTTKVLPIENIQRLSQSEDLLLEENCNEKLKNNLSEAEFIIEDPEISSLNGLVGKNCIIIGEQEDFGECFTASNIT